MKKKSAAKGRRKKLGFLCKKCMNFFCDYGGSFRIFFATMGGRFEFFWRLWGWWFLIKLLGNNLNPYNRVIFINISTSWLTSPPMMGKMKKQPPPYDMQNEKTAPPYDGQNEKTAPPYYDAIFRKCCFFIVLSWFFKGNFRLFSKMQKQPPLWCAKCKNSPPITIA